MSRERRIEDDEMLVTHPPAETKARAERTEQGARSAATPKALAARLAAATNPAQRKRIIKEIQERLGNREAERIIRSVAKAGRP